MAYVWSAFHALLCILPCSDDLLPIFLYYTTYKGSYMSVHVLLNLLSWGQDKMQGFAKHILSVFPNVFNELNNIEAWIQDSIYHMILKSHFISNFCTKNVKILLFENATFYGCLRRALQSNLHIQSTSGLSFLMHRFIIRSRVWVCNKAMH